MNTKFRPRISAIALGVLLLACGQQERPSHPRQVGHKPVKRVGVFLFAQHPIIKEIYSGFEPAFKAAASKHNVTVEFVERNADGDAAQAGSIASFFKNGSVDAVVVIGLPAAQKLKAAGFERPVIFAGVPDPVAAGLVPQLARHGTNFTGTRYFPAIDANLKVFKLLVPGAKTVAVLHNPGEANSMAVVKEFLRQAPAVGLDVQDLGVTNIVEIDAALRVLEDKKPDGLFIPTDNLVYSSLDRIAKETKRMGVPMFNCTRLSVEKGAIFSVATDYVQVGRLTADVAAQVILGARRPEEVDVLDIREGYLYVRNDTTLPATLNLRGYPIEHVK